jgi:hypothetical protein
MSSEGILLLAAGAAALVLLVAVALVARSGARTRRELGEALEAARGEARELAARVDALERTAARDASPSRPPVIEGRVPEEPNRPDARPATDAEPTVTIDGRIDGRLFADLVARESTIKAAGLVHGLRRALAPETRNRIGFEVRQEVKRSRRQRRADLRAAVREQQARERREMGRATPGDTDDWDAA